MAIVKQFYVNSALKAAANQALKSTLPSDLVFSLGAAFFEKSNKTRSYAEKEFYRKAVNRLVQTMKNLRALEEQYYG